jgi:hypothetical protein
VSVDVTGWAAGLDELHERVAHRFGRSEPRRRALSYLRGLLAGLERKNGWTLAEHADEVCPDGAAAAAKVRPAGTPMRAR